MQTRQTFENEFKVYTVLGKPNKEKPLTWHLHYLQ